MNITIVIETAEQLMVAGKIIDALHATSAMRGYIQSERAELKIDALSSLIGRELISTQKADFVFTFPSIQTAANAEKHGVYIEHVDDLNGISKGASLYFVANIDIVQAMKENGYQNTYLTGSIQMELSDFYKDTVFEKEVARLIAGQQHAGDMLASVRIAEIIKHHLSPEPGT